MLIDAAAELDPVEALQAAFMADVASVIETPWNMSTGPDLAFPSTRGSRPEKFEEAQQFEAAVFAGLRLSAPPSILDTLLAPLLGAFQASYPNVRVQVLVTDRFVDLIAEGIDLVFRGGALSDSSLVARRFRDLSRFHPV